MRGPRPALSIVVPALNERTRLPRALAEIRRYVEARERDTEVIVVDDGSTDGTAGAARAAADEWPAVRVFSFLRNRGKGAAVRAGVAASRGDVVAYTDADLAAPLDQLDLLLEDLRDADVAIVSRALPGTTLERRQSLPREAMGRLYARLSRLLLLRGVPDAQCGLKAFRADVARDVFARVGEDGIIFDTEALLVATRRGACISQRPAVWRHDPDTRIHMDPLRALGVGVALLRVKLRHGGLVPPRAAGPIRDAARSPAYRRATPAPARES